MERASELIKKYPEFWEGLGICIAVACVSLQRSDPLTIPMFIFMSMCITAITFVAAIVIMDDVDDYLVKQKEKQQKIEVMHSTTIPEIKTVEDVLPAIGSVMEEYMGGIRRYYSLQNE